MYTLSLSSYRVGDPPNLHSFPTRRSSDLDFDQALGTRRDAYERLLEDAIEGDAKRFARADAVEESWRVVQPVIDHPGPLDRKSTRLNSSHMSISYAVFCLKKKNLKRYYVG